MWTVQAQVEKWLAVSKTAAVQVQIENQLKSEGKVPAV